MSVALSLKVASGNLQSLCTKGSSGHDLVCGSTLDYSLPASAALGEHQGSTDQLYFFPGSSNHLLSGPSASSAGRADLGSLTMLVWGVLAYG
jgi:hypothetical protein